MRFNLTRVQNRGQKLCLFQQIDFQLMMFEKNCKMRLDHETNTVDSSICENYKQVEKEFKCGTNGYPLNYGYKYCLNFTNKKIRERFSDIGKKFIDCTTKCLIDKIWMISENSTNCQQIQERAFHSHVDCYLTCDFCKVCKTQKIPLMHSYDWSDFLSFDATQQVYSIVKKCGVFTCFM